jgi:poly-gamma-glutamate synthesis protein (capsule biosynthesis protein)
LSFAAGLVAAACALAATPQPSALRIWLGGDVQLDPASAQGALAAVARLVPGAAGIVNLEGPIAAAPAPGARLRLVNPPGAVAALRSAGVRLASIANNHAGDAGPDGGAATARALRAGGILPAGGAAGFGLLELGGVRVAVSAHDLGATAGQLPAALGDDLRRARRAADVLVATFHVTGPPSYLPNAAATRAVDEALAAGAAVVALHGSHVLGRVERRAGAVVAWGLGNLAFACDCTHESEALLLEVDVGARGAARAAVIPIEAGILGAPVRPAPDPQGIFDLLAALGSAPLKRSAQSAEF